MIGRPRSVASRRKWQQVFCLYIWADIRYCHSMEKSSWHLCRRLFVQIKLPCPAHHDFAIISSINSPCKVTSKQKCHGSICQRPPNLMESSRKDKKHVTNYNCSMTKKTLKNNFSHIPLNSSTLNGCSIHHYKKTRTDKLNTQTIYNWTNESELNFVFWLLDSKTVLPESSSQKLRLRGDCALGAPWPSPSGTSASVFAHTSDFQSQKISKWSKMSIEKDCKMPSTNINSTS